MSSVNPFTIDIGPSFNLASAYWRCGLCVAGYQHDSLVSISAFANLFGVTSVSELSFPLPLPDRVFLLVFPTGVCIVTNGTTNTVQYLSSAVGAIFVTNAFGPGLVNGSFAFAAAIINGTVSAALTPIAPAQVVYYGHSLGGAVSQLLCQAQTHYPVAGSWSIGQPRVGNLVFSNGFAPHAERWTTPGDPVPALPPSFQPLIDLTLDPYWYLLPTSYAHTGTRRNVYPDGSVDSPAELPTWSEAMEILEAAALRGIQWYTAHSALNYAGRIRRGIPVPFLGSDPDWPLIGAIDALFVPFLVDFDGDFPLPLFTDLGATENPISQYGVQGICK